jgi:uncharacterized protein (TIGR01319 family)
VEVRRIKARVDDERLPRGADRHTHLKLGRGGLADVEWTVQLLQMRHAGTVETVYTAQGPVQMQRGKDLSGVQWLIGTGGAIVHARDPGSVLRVACADPALPAQLRPRAPRLAIDASYLLYAAGLLAQVDPRAAFDCARNHLRIVD